MESRTAISNSELSGYVESLKEEMKRKSFSDFSIRTMNGIWQDLLLFYSESSEIRFDEACRQKFLTEYCAASMELRYSMFRITRAVYMLSDYIDFHVIFRQYCTLNEPFSKGYIDLFEGMINEEQRRNLAPGSLKSIRSRLMRFHDFLRDTGAETPGDITQEQVNTYILSLVRYSTTYVSETLRMLRKLLQYAYHNGFCERDLSRCIPHVKNIGQQKIPSTFTADETQMILKSIDRENPIGRRDYAVVMLAARLGLRSSDIMALTFSNIDWDAKIISFTQQKTRRALSLPLPDDVGWAVIDYLKNGRPISDVQNIFISHVPPYGPLKTLCSIVPRQMRKAGIRTPANKRQGMHAFRHGLATRMLEENVPIPVISQTLGHADINSTEIYIRISIRQLSMCGLEVDL